MSLFIGDTTTGERHFLSSSLEQAVCEAAAYVGMRPEVFAAGPLWAWRDNREAAIGTGDIDRLHREAQAMLDSDDEEVEP